MKTNFDGPQLYLRLALGIGFLLPVMDRLGILGPAGVNGTAWGNWANFVNYTNSLMPYASNSVASVLGAIATIGEIVFGVLLIVGYKTRLAALGSFLLTLCFALSMLCFSGYRSPFSYSVFVCSAASLVLANMPGYRWSIDGMNKGA